MQSQPDIEELHPLVPTAVPHRGDTSVDFTEDSARRVGEDEWTQRIFGEGRRNNAAA